jgi:hypothetical protein
MKHVIRAGLIIISGLITGMTANYFGVNELIKALLISLSVVLTNKFLSRLLNL